MYLIKLLKNKNHPNILLYNLYDDNNIINALNSIYNIKSNIITTENNISYIENNIYFVFNIDKIKYLYKLDFIYIIKNIISQNKNKYIIFNNLESNTSIQNILKIIIEKNTHIKFIIISKKITNIIEPIKSRFLCIRFPNTDKSIGINKYKQHIFDYIFELYYDKNKNTIKNIKYISYILRCINDTFSIFLKELFEYIINRTEITENIKYKCIYIISDIEYKYNNGYYKIIYYEYILIKLYTIIKT
jgi:hypothetical protein